MQKKYRLISHTVEAIQLLPETVETAAMWSGGMVVTEYDAINRSQKFVAMNIPTITGVKRASEGDYIVKDAAGAITVCHKNAFEAQYELAE